ncbi:MAG TPA: hypothetical protein PKM25_01630 [Candidatus Ozemobacteraceae bacterium]|nr:hypothetical protein [Candidatus Ozemobacteraceae bacterium]
MGRPEKSSLMEPLVGRFARQGFVLFFVCVFAILMMILLVSLNTHKSGEVFQLGRSIEQERIVLVAEAVINEMLASVKAGVNDRNSSVGNELYNFWKSNPAAGSKLVFETDFTSSQLPVSTSLGDDYLGNDADLSGHVSIVIMDKIGGPRPSYAGYVELIGKVKSQDLPEIKLKERREIKIADLSYPFIDKYALFVKSFCRLLNNPKKRIVIKGIAPDDPGVYSFVYLGNRSYPVCPEFPQGARSVNTPPVLLDLCFKDDNHLLGAFYRPASFQTVVSRYEQASNGNLFFVIPPFDFRTVSGSFSKSTDFHTTPELVTIYKAILNASSKYAGNEGTMGYMIAKDYQKSGGNPGNSEVFRSLISSLMQDWKYQYGYTDYSCIVGEKGNTFVNEEPFSGIGQYFKYFMDKNPQRVMGGKMPLLFGEGRDIPVYVEGPVYLRFFKIAFLDQAKVKFELHGGSSMDVSFPPVPLHYEDSPRTFSGKPCTPQIDERTKVLMSNSIESLSINNLFFGGNTKTAKTPTSVQGGIEGYDVFPAFDESLRSVAHVYQTADEFTKDRIKTIDGQKVLDLDGISLILCSDKKSLSLTSVEKYRGKGRIILSEGHCILGNLAPLNIKTDSLSLYLMFGNFLIESSATVVNIFASLAATTCFRDNSSPAFSAESGISFGGKSVNIYGNLFVDNLFDLRTLPDGGQLTIVHDPNLYFPEYPVRVSIGETRSLLAVDYHGE